MPPLSLSSPTSMAEFREEFEAVVRPSSRSPSPSLASLPQLPPPPPPSTTAPTLPSDSEFLGLESLRPSMNIEATAAPSFALRGVANNILPAPLTASHRNRSPVTRLHARSRSLAGPLGSPSMTRAHSSPGLDSRGRYIPIANNLCRPSSPMDPPGRRSSPGRAAEEIGHMGLGSLTISETITEQVELEKTGDVDIIESERPTTSSPLPSVMHHTFPFARRRPSSPFHPALTASSLTSTHSSPVITPTRFNEPFPSLGAASSGSSIPSTPTSLRSRSPSISSLETIPDIPDAEAAALEADRISRLKAAAEQAEVDMTDTDHSRRRGNLDNPISPFPMGGMRGPGGYGMRADKRKRWSVCGAERRQDLDLETIWED